jgi:drug/metabolite transporter (DMT)-like permease
MPDSTGILLAICGASGFAMKAVFAKLAYQHGVDAITLVTMRLLLAMGLLVAVRAGIRCWRKTTEIPFSLRQWAMLVGLGLLGYYLSSLLDFMGLETVSASLERLILCLYPTFTVILSAVLTGTALTATMKKAMPLTYAGMALVLWPDLGQAHADWLGVSLIFLSTLCFSVYLTFSPRVIQEVGSMRFTEWATGVSCLGMLVHYACARPWGTIGQQAPQVWGYAALIALFSTVLPLYATNAAMARIGSARTALIGSFGPLLTIFISMGMLGEYFQTLQWLGAALVLLGVAWVGKKN